MEATRKKACPQMKSAVSLMYHDTFADGDIGSSGRSGVGPDLYKVDVERFRSQMEGLQARYGSRISTVPVSAGSAIPLLVTFDDGGVSAYTQVADILEQSGIFGHFFVTTDYIGRPGFLSVEQIQALDHRGHVVGSHSRTHPDIITRLTYEQALDEWRQSTDRLARILGHPVHTASIPGGEYGKGIARAASESGIRFLFTSEPVKATWKIADCTVLGRYTVLQHTSDETVFDLASERSSGSQRRQARSWYAKKLVKKACGPFYLAIRNRVLSTRRRGTS